MSHLPVHQLLLAASSTKSNGSAITLLLPVIVIGALFLLMFRGQRGRARAAQQMQAGLGVGSDVVTAGGIHGTVTSMDPDAGTLTLSVAPGVELRFDRRSVSRVVSPSVDPLTGPPVESTVHLPSEDRPSA